MDGAQQRYIASCPLGCAGSLAVTDIVLPEGPLMRCPECGQRVSQATEAQYVRSLGRFNTAEGTLPAAHSSPAPVQGLPETCPLTFSLGRPACR